MNMLDEDIHCEMLENEISKQARQGVLASRSAIDFVISNKVKIQDRA